MLVNDKIIQGYSSILMGNWGYVTLNDLSLFRIRLRCNVTIAQGNEEHLGLFIHVVRGDNDDALRWPMQVKKLGSH